MSKPTHAFVWSAVVVFVASLAACDKKSSKNGGDAAPASASTATPVSSGTTTSPSPCLRLQDTTVATTSDPAVSNTVDPTMTTTIDPMVSTTSDPAVGTTSDPTAATATSSAASPTISSNCDTTVPTDPTTGGTTAGGTTAGDTTGADPSVGDPSGGGGWSAGPGLEECEAQGVAWKAVVGGGPAQCSTDPLVAWCCTEQNVLAHFPSLAADLSSKYFGPYAQAGLKLYHCSHSGDKTTLHFASYSAGHMTYKTVFFSGPEAQVAEPASCTKVTSADLGILNDTVTDTSTDYTDYQDDGGLDDSGIDDGGGDTDTSTGTTTAEVPSPIGELSDTTRDGLVSWLKGATYRNWTARDSNCISIPDHANKVKRYYNTTAIDSLDPDAFAEYGKSLKKGSIAVLEVYNSGCAQVLSVSVLARGLDMFTKSVDAWLYYKETGAPEFDETEPAAYGMGVSTCAGCHKVSDTMDVLIHTTATN